MNKIAYKIITNYGHIYSLSKEGYVLKYSGNDLDKMNSPESELKSWQVRGVTPVNSNMSNIINLISACDLNPLLYKNGNPKYTIVDLDRGTLRVHGNTKVHGIVSICKIYK
jgi:hypothetical protein